MKSQFLRPIVFSLAISLCCLVPQALAQDFSIDWFTIDSGGGTSTGGVYSVSGTLGQPDASHSMTGGGFSITGRFWSLLSVVQTPGAPLLSITRTGTTAAIVSWPSGSTGFTLQQNTNLNSLNWIAASETVTNDGSTNFIIVNPAAGNRFYRLFKPRDLSAQRSGATFPP